MNSLILGILLFTGAAAVSFGDFTQPVNASTYDDGKLRALFHIDQPTSTLTVFMKFKAYGYFCLLYSSQMANGDYNNIELAPGVVTLLDEYSPGSHQEPLEDTTNNLNFLGYDTDQSTYVTVKYSRLLNTGDAAGKDAVLAFGKTYKWAYAWKTGSLVMQYHGKEYKTFSVPLDNVSTGGTSGSGMSNLELVHAIILSVLWILVVDVAIFVKYLYSFRYRILVHGLLMFLAMAGTIILVALIIHENQPKISEQSSPIRAHYVIGLIVLAWVILQCLLGLLQRILLCYVINPFVIYAMRKIHLYSGIILILLGKANVVLGWAMESSAVGLAVCCSIMGISLLLLLLFIFLNSGSISNEVFAPRAHSIYNDRWIGNTPQGIPFSPVSNPAILALMRLPYCWPQVQLANIFLYDDRVYPISSLDFHPGGRKVIEEVRGREADRFLYGSMFTEEHAKQKPFDHPKQSMLVVDEPLAALPPNPICTLNDRVFAVSSFIKIVEDVNIFYFSPRFGSILYQEPTSMRHIGQYFVVRAFGHTRLYTCLLSQRSEKRRARQELLNRLVPAQQRILRLPPPTNTQSAGLTSSNTALTTTAFINMPNHDSLPLIIKRYRKPASRFTNMLYSQPGAEFLIQGPKGRGMCLEALPAGNVVVIAGGTGLFPFLDLIDEIFKLTVSNRGASVGMQAIPQSRSPQQVRAAQTALTGKSFHIFVSVNSFNELIIPDEMHIINSANTPLAKIYVRVSGKVPGGAFSGFTIGQQMKFGKQLVVEKIAPLSGNLRMVYICGPQQMYQDMSKALGAIGVQRDRIFYV